MSLRKDPTRDAVRAARETATLAVANAALASPYVNALRLGREASSGNADVVASLTFFQQPIATTGAEKWRGNPIRANGLHFHVPYDANTLLVHNPDTGKMWRYTAAQLGLASTAFDGTQKWNRGVVGRDGRIYCIPYDATAVLVIDPVALTATLETFGLPTSALSGGDKWDGGAMDSNGVIWCAPYASVNVLAIDTVNQSARVLTAAQLGMGGTALNGSAKYSGAVFVGGKVYCIPFVENDVLVIDCAAATATQPTYGLTLSDSSKWSGAAVVGTLIYCCPFSSEDILVIDTVAATAVRHNMGPAGVSTPLTGSNKWRGLVRVGGKLYGIPVNSVNFLVIDILTTGAGINTYGTAARDNFDAYDIRTPSTKGDLPGGASIRWSGGIAYKGIIYGTPCGTVQAGQDMLVLDPVAEQAYHTDGRALYSVTAATKWFGGVQHPSGWAVTIPAEATDFLLIKDDDPDDDFPVAVRSTLGLSLNSNPQKFQGGALLGDNCIYAMPRSGETNMLKIDLSDKTGSPYGTATLFGANTAVDLDAGTTGNPLAIVASPYVLGGTDSQAFHSCVVGMDGKLYGIPYRSTKVLIFDHTGTPGSLTNPQLALTDFGLDLSGTDKWVGGCLHPNGKIYCGPRSRNTCLVIDTNPLSATYGQAWLTNFGVDLDAGSGVSGVNLAMKWSYPKLGADNRIYVGPRKAANLLVIDPGDTSLDEHGRATFEDFGLDMSSFATIDGYSIATKMAGDGKLYIAALEGLGPAGTGPFLVVDTITRTASWETFGLPTTGAVNLNTGNKCAGVIYTLAGALIFVPRSAQYAIRIRPKCQPLPPEAVFHPAMFAN